ncbi:MAG: Na/Pi cotransporter family protein, partial [Duncaniella sp.]|nr:Na/Pi cotransporter family protein [Duncaniella sp.]
MFISVEAAMTNMILLLNDIENVREKDIITSYNLERETNNLRNQFRADNVENINAHRYEYQAGIYYMDIIGTLEKTGDYVINVVDEIKTQLRSSLVKEKK